MAYYAMERLRHSLTPRIEYDQRKWDKAYNYLNHYFDQQPQSKYETARDTFSETQPNAMAKSVNIPKENIYDPQDTFGRTLTETNAFNTNASETFNSSTDQKYFKKIKPMQNTYHIPNYAGYVPGMTTQNPFAKTFTKASIEEILHFDRRRANRNYDVQLSKKWNYDPLSRTYGNFSKPEMNFHSSRLQRSIINHPYTLRVRATSFNKGSDWKTPEVFNKRMLQTGTSTFPRSRDYSCSLPKFCKPTPVPNQ